MLKEQTKKLLPEHLNPYQSLEPRPQVQWTAKPGKHTASHQTLSADQDAQLVLHHLSKKTRNTSYQHSANQEKPEILLKRASLDAKVAMNTLSQIVQSGESKAVMH